jgi:RNA polymerase sigma-70 factor (ECF subfamily)
MTKAEAFGDPGESAARRMDWNALLAQHQRWLRTVVVARLGDAEGADEVLQEVALAAVRQRAPISDPTKTAPWLYRLAVLQSLLYRRGRGRQRKLVARFAERVPAAGEGRSVDPLAWLLADERKRLVSEALSRLPGRDAEILLLKYTENWSYHQIAEHLGIGHSAVETRLFRARGKLRAELAAYELTEVRG